MDERRGSPCMFVITKWLCFDVRMEEVRISDWPEPPGSSAWLPAYGYQHEIMDKDDYFGSNGESCRSSTDEAIWVGIWKRKLEPADRRWRLACVCVSIHLNLTLPSNEPCTFFNTVTPLFLHGVATDPKLQALFSLYLPILFWVHTQVGAHPANVCDFISPLHCTSPIDNRCRVCAKTDMSLVFCFCRVPKTKRKTRSRLQNRPALIVIRFE